MSVLIRKAQRKVTRARVAVSGPSGSGKTLTALLLAYGMTGDWEKIGLIDTENRSADLYADTLKADIHIPEFAKIDLEPPYTTEKYLEAIKAFEDAGFEAIIIDSGTHAWAGEGGLLEQQGAISKRSGMNSYTAWGEITPKQNKFVEGILKSSCHIIMTLRSKTEYVLVENSKGKMEPRKVGMAPIQRDGLEYEMTLMIEMNVDHYANVSKDRTGLFDGQYFTPGVETGEKLIQWLESGVKLATRETVDSIREKWAALNFNADKIDDQCKKSYGSQLNALTEPQAQDFLTKLEGLMQTKLAQPEQAATVAEGA